MPKKEEILKKKQAEFDLQILQSFADRNRFANEHGEHLVHFIDYLRLSPYLNETDEEKNGFAYLFNLTDQLYRAKNNLKQSGIYVDQPLRDWEIDTSRLNVGDVFPNYKSLCEHLGQEAKKGNQRKLQQEMFQRYFDFEKVEGSQQIVIMDVYPEPTEKTNFRNTKFINQIKVLIMWLLCEEYHNGKGENGIITYNTSNSNLMNKLNLVNFYFWGKGNSSGKHSSLNYFLKTYPQLFSYDSSISDSDSFLWNSRVFFNITMDRIKDAIKSALKSLQLDDIISYEPGYMAIVKSDNRYTKIPVTEEEKAILKEIRKDIALAMGYKNSRHACLYNPDEFNRQFSHEIMERFGWECVYFNIKISVTAKNLFREINSYTALSIDHSAAYMSVDELSDIHDTYEKNMIDAINECAFSYFKKAENENAEHQAAAIRDNNEEVFGEFTEQEIIEMLELTNKGKSIKYNEKFVERMRVLAKTMIPIESGHEIEIVMNSAPYVDIIE